MQECCIVSCTILLYRGNNWLGSLFKLLQFFFARFPCRNALQNGNFLTPSSFVLDYFLGSEYPFIAGDSQVYAELPGLVRPHLFSVGRIACMNAGTHRIMYSAKKPLETFKISELKISHCQENFLNLQYNVCSVCMCLYLCVCICACVCLYLCMRVCVYLFVCVCACVCMCVCV